MKNAMYVKCLRSGKVLVQLDDDNPYNEFGFVLADDDQTWDGGMGSGMKQWEAVPESEVSEEDRERLGWMLLPE